MKTSQILDPQSLTIEKQLVGINAKTAPYLDARSWSGGRRRIVGKGPFESYTYDVKNVATHKASSLDVAVKQASRYWGCKLGSVKGSLHDTRTF